MIKKTLTQIKWIIKQGRPILFLVTLLIILKSIFSFIGVLSALVSKNLIDSATNGETSTMFKWIMVMGIIMIINLSSSLILPMLSAYTSTKFTNSLQKKIFKHITYSKWMESSRYHSVNLINRMTSDVSTINSLLTSTLPKIFSLCTTLISSFIALYYLEPKLAILAIIIFPILITISLILSKLIKKLYMQIQDLQIQYKIFIQESIQNMLIVKTFCHEEINLKKIEKLQKEKMNLSLKTTLYGSFANLFLKIGSALGYFIVFCFGAIKLSKGIGTFGTLTALLQLFNNIQRPLKSLATAIPSLITALAATERLMEIERLTLEENQNLSKEFINENFINHKVLSKAKIQLNNVSFSYEKSKPMLKNINFNINSGEIVGLIGHSGGGKTTLIRLILQLINAEKGEISLTINDTTLNKTTNYRSLISYVPQGNTLFSGTIKENILYGNTDASEEEIINSLKKAQAFDFIEKLPEKINTKIHEKGTGLSEGQAQRICIARAFISKKPVLILDEATSSLDINTELKVLDELKTLAHKPTCIIITHRLIALNICNKTFKLENGTLRDVTDEIKNISFKEIASTL